MNGAQRTGAQRAFVAVRPSEGALDAVADAVGRVQGVSAGLRWVERDDWHLTLQFLGRVRDVAGVIEALSAMVGSERPFWCRLGGGGAFPSASRARVVWLGVVEGALSLESLARAVADCLTVLGYEPDERPLHPHLTVARLSRAVSAGTVVEALGAAPVGDAWQAARIGLYESRPSSRGARYRLLADLPLGVVEGA